MKKMLCEMLVNLWMVKDFISFHRELLSNKFQLVYNALLGFLGFYIYCADEEGSKCNVVKNLEEQKQCNIYCKWS